MSIVEQAWTWLLEQVWIWIVLAIVIGVAVVGRRSPAQEDFDRQDPSVALGDFFPVLSLPEVWCKGSEGVT